MIITENISLKKYNSFGIDAMAAYFASFKSAEELIGILNQVQMPPAFILGGGSNILLTKDIDGLVLHNEIKGIEITEENDDYVLVKAGAGENWHSFVLFCIEHKLAGVENLALIPGSVGASPMQNIGAYGVELKDVFQELRAFHLTEKTNYTFNQAECAFGYRDSVFKGKYRNKFVILDVTFKLLKKPVFNTRYGAIEQELEKMGVKQLSIRAIADAVINIRRSKLPDPAVTGNAGSFFKNPVIEKIKFKQLKELFPAIIAYDNNDSVKLAAGWLIEQCGWKGYRRGDAGCHAAQSLVLVNYGHATGAAINDLADEITVSVDKKFGVKLEKEVNII